METADRGASATPHNVAIRDSAPPSAHLTRPASRPPPADIWAGAISRLQTQVSYNTSMLESNRRQISDMEHAVNKFHHDMNGVFNALNDLRSKVGSSDAPHHDSGDLDVLASQIAAVTSKANEVEGMKMQLELMKNRIRRIEESGSPALPPGGRSSMLSGPPRKSSLDQQGPPQPPPQHYQPLPPMRTASMVAASDGHAPSYGRSPVIGSEASPGFRPMPESRPFSNEHAQTPSSVVRQSDSLPPSTLTGWRAGENGPPGSVPPSTSQASIAGRPVDGPPSGWAAVNVNQAAKRPLEELRRYESPIPGSPKRAKLQSLMPRRGYSEEGFAPGQPDFPPGPHGPPEIPLQPRSRVPSDSSQSQPHPPPRQPPAPTSANPGASYRFITTTQQLETPVEWRTGEPGQLPPSGGRGRGRVRGRGRGGRGGRGRGGTATHEHSHGHGNPHDHHPHHGHGNHHEFMSQNGNHPHSPRGGHMGVLRRSGGYAGGTSGRSPPLHGDGPPETPIHIDSFAVQHVDPNSNSGSKKSRTKPVRNAEGILIRKDGRPDMRSVSSANNLRKVHAKKEAERADGEGRTPTSIPPGESHIGSGDEGDGDEAYSQYDHSRSASPGSTAGEGKDSHDRHQALMSKIFPRGIDVHSASSRSTAERYFPARSESASEPTMKMESDLHAPSGDSYEEIVVRSVHTSRETAKPQTPPLHDDDTFMQESVEPERTALPAEKRAELTQTTGPDV